VKQLNKIIKTKIILKYKLDNEDELQNINIMSLINDKDILEKSIEVSYKNKDRILIIDYLKELKSIKETKEE